MDKLDQDLSEGEGGGSFAIVEAKREDPVVSIAARSKTLSKLFGSSMWRPGANKINLSSDMSQGNHFKSTLLLNF